MDNNLATLCLIAVGVGLMILIAGALLLSVLRGSVFGLGMMVMRMISEPEKEETKIDPAALAQTRSASDDLRARAQSLDFDAAVARYRQDEGAGGGAPPPNSPFPNAPGIAPPDARTQGFPPPNQPRRDDDDPLRRR